MSRPPVERLDTPFPAYNPAVKARLSLLLLIPLTYCYAQNAPLSPSDIQISRITYHGWANSYRISNGRVEAIVVPTIGRVMQFHYLGREEISGRTRRWLGKVTTRNPGNGRTLEEIRVGRHRRRSGRRWPVASGRRPRASMPCRIKRRSKTAPWNWSHQSMRVTAFVYGGELSFLWLRLGWKLSPPTRKSRALR